jgi:hypothetical protein
MANSKWEVMYMNDWNNPVVLFRGTEEECNQWYEENIEECESCDAFCSPVSDSDVVYDWNHKLVYMQDYDLGLFE